MERTNKEVLQKLLDNIDKLNSGLCSLAFHLYERSMITRSECVEIKYYIGVHRPIQTYEGTWYYWKPGLKEPRIEWLKTHIELN